jgi:NAD(P)-dependent dehydrogenase (short-subunit alcohol dehydrogenase family)
MSIVITGATGQLGRLVVEQLIAAGTPPDTIVATGRDTDKLSALSGDGVTVRRADFADPSTLTDAFAGAKTGRVRPVQRLLHMQPGVRNCRCYSFSNSMSNSHSRCPHDVQIGHESRVLDSASIVRDL